MLTDLKTELAPQRARFEPPGIAGMAVAGGIAGAIHAPYTFGLSVVAGAVAGAVLGAVYAPRERPRPVEETRLSRHRINEVRQAIDDDKNECQKVKAKEDVFRKYVDEFAVFCREHIDSVLASRLVEDEFAFLLDILRGTRSHGAAQPRPRLLPEDVNVHFERVSNLLEQLLHSTSNNEDSRITQQILDELQESPTDQEIQTRIMNFMETQFAEACATQL